MNTEALKVEVKSSGFLPGVVGRSPLLRAAADQISLIAGTDVTCLLTGETGTGKELFARAIHYLSSRKNGPFVPLNCGAVPDQLFENELFGHVRGAFTDARSDECGLLACAKGGTLFLDEVDALSASGQVKLLRVLQEREYRPIGSARMIPANIRIVAATNGDLGRNVGTGRFREDLYFRLNILGVTIPPLRERPEDIAVLALHFAQEYAQIFARPVNGVEASAVDRLMRYHWPGNVREFQTVMQRSVLRTKGPLVSGPDLDLPGVAKVESGHVTLKAARSMAIMQCERNYISAVLRRCGGNITQAARMAGKERRSFQRLLRKHSIAAIPLDREREAS
jgi:transcriptional regulator with PAS, ATPase and Fis domain